ncbi:iron-sulfur cluster co-chaperone protein HscB [Aethina tumida]|uniref:iron-sulfur cluster co-chaperone protein HscB n=1 Tax=Aethina tumida TaxID=116153 RepID=UPI002148AC8E|nr:iron-sulfur cluster co-chaperone protein HscB [Aethina tumida]
MEIRVVRALHQIKRQLGVHTTKRYMQTKCWKCGIERSRRALFCDKCNMIQSPEVKDNYFKVFEIEERYDVDLKNLRNKYRNMQSVLHPDKFSTKTDEEKHISEEYSSLINKAYNSLLTPIARAVHLLNIKGGKIDEEQKIEDPAFLMEIMEINEQIDEAETPDDIRKLNEQNQKVMSELGDKIAQCFNSNNLNGAKDFIIKLKYFTSINNRISNLMRERGMVD